MDERKSQLEELHATSKPLIDSCSPEIVQKITESVQEAESGWNETTENLRDLCTKYKRAVQLWEKYRDASEAIKDWADDQMGTIGTLQPLDSKHVEVSILYFAVNIE